MAEKNVSYSVDADPSGFRSGFEQAAQAARAGASQINAQLENIQATVERLNGYFVAMTALLAGGKMFGDVIKDAKTFDGEVGNLSRKLGITTEQASGMVVAMNNLGVSTTDYVDASMKLVKQINKNEDGLKAMGLQTRDNHGNLRNLKDLMDDAFNSLRQYKEGTDRAAAAQAIFGKGGDQVLNLLKLTNAEWAQGAEEAERLGVVLGKDDVKAAKDFERNLRELHDTSEALSIKTGNAVIPVLNKVASIFLDDLPRAIEASKSKYNTFADHFIRRSNEIMDSVKPLLATLYSWVDALDQKLDAIRPDWVKKKRAAYDAAVAATRDYAHSMDAEMAKLKRQNDLAAGTPGADTSGEGTKSFQGDPTKQKSRAALWEAELAERKLNLTEQATAEGRFYSMSAAEERRFWQQKLALTRAGSEEQIAVRQKLATAGTRALDEDFRGVQASLQAQEAAYRFNTEARIILLNREGELVKQKYGEQSQQYQEVQKRIVEAKRQGVEQIRQIEAMRAQVEMQRQLNELEMLSERVTLERDIGIILPMEALQTQAAIEQRRAQIIRDGLQERLRIAELDPDRNPVLIAQLHAQIEEAELQHQRRIGQIANEGERFRMNYAIQAQQAVAGGLANVFAQTMQGHMRLNQLMRNSLIAVGQAATNVMAQIAAQWLVTNLFAKASSEKSGLTQVKTNAAVAGSGAYASTAAIPIVGPELAPIAADIAYAGALAFGLTIPAAEGGWDIPRGLNPITQLHEKEMVLPEGPANVIRDLAEDGGSGNAEAAPAVTVHQHFSALDGPSVQRVLRQHHQHLIDAIQEAWRRGVRPKK